MYCTQDSAKINANIRANWSTDVWVGGAAGTSYTFKAKARYDGIYTQNTYLGVEGSGMTTPEPGGLLALLSGVAALAKFESRRRR